MKICSNCGKEINEVSDGIEYSNCIMCRRKSDHFHYKKYRGLFVENGRYYMK